MSKDFIIYLEQHLVMMMMEVIMTMMVTTGLNQ